jgi:hypothetical protein
MTTGSSTRAQGYYHEIKADLVAHDPVFASLEEEKRLGWESKDVERLWKLRTEKLNVQNDRTSEHKQFSKQGSKKSENPFTALMDDVEEEDEGAEESGVSHNKVMRAAGKGPSYDKYYAFYKELFESVPEHSSVFSINGRKRFMDIGCAPGGLCAYFVRDLGWSGIGFTLQLERGGLKVRFKDPSLEVHHCDMSEIESVKFINERVAGCPKFDFINCGVVMGKHQLESIGEDRETAIQILRVNRNQFLVALQWLAKGGDMFWVFQSSNIGSWFYFLGKLQKCFKKPISLFSTLVPSRSPVYALCRDFDPDCAATKAWMAELESTTEFDETHLGSTWNITTWAEAEPVIKSMETDMHKIWSTQRDGLREIRLAATLQLGKEELLLKKLSGSHHGSGTHTPSDRPSSFNKHHPSKPLDGDWRRGAQEVEDGWQTTTAKPAAKQRSTRSNNPRTPSVSDEDWRRK